MTFSADAWSIVSHSESQVHPFLNCPNQPHGRSSSAEAEAPVGHLGSEMMRRRVADRHGTLDVQSTPGKGTRVVARLAVTDEGVSE